jgi:hypothetical protein
MDDEHLTPPGKKGENGKSANDNSGEETTQNGIKHISPAKDSLIEILEIAGTLIFGIIAFVCADAGFHILGIIFGYLAVVCGMGIVAHHLQKFGVKFVKTGLVVSVILLAALFVFLALHKSPPETKPYPHFSFSVLKQERTLEDAVELTNEFVVIPSGPVAINNLLCPITVPDNFVFRLNVQNMGPPMSENARITILFPKELSCYPSPEWDDDERGQFSALTFHPPNLLSGDSWELPDIRFRHTPLSPADGNLRPLICFILARAKDSPAELVEFNFVFLLISTKVSLMPIIAPSTNIGGGKSVSVIPPEIMKALKR